MAAASGIYESLTFTQQTVNGRRSYLEWKATAFGGVPLRGVSMLTKDDEDRIVDVAIHHRPLHAAGRAGGRRALLSGRAADPRIAAVVTQVPTISGVEQGSAGSLQRPPPERPKRADGGRAGQLWLPDPVAPLRVASPVRPGARGVAGFACPCRAWNADRIPGGGA